LNDKPSKFVLQVADSVADYLRQEKERGKHPDFKQTIWWKIGNYTDRQKIFVAVQKELKRRSAEKRRSDALAKKNIAPRSS
jgi:predicted secreted hydrolase